MQRSGLSDRLPGWLDPLGYGLLSAGQLRLLDFDRDPIPRLAADPG
jgi:hypothetical protein